MGCLGVSLGGGQVLVFQPLALPKLSAPSPATLDHPPADGDGRGLNSLPVDLYLSACFAYHVHAGLGINSGEANAFNIIFHIMYMMMCIL